MNFYKFFHTFVAVTGLLFATSFGVVAEEKSPCLKDNSFKESELKPDNSIGPAGVGAISGVAGGGVAAATIATAKAAGISAVSHVGGSAIVTAGGSYVGGTIGTIFAAALAAPVIVTAGAVAAGAAIGVGGYYAYEYLNTPSTEDVITSANDC